MNAHNSGRGQIFLIVRMKMVRGSLLTLTGLEGHICPSVVTSWWRHCDVIYIMNLLVQKEILHCGQGNTSS